MKLPPLLNKRIGVSRMAVMVEGYRMVTGHHGPIGGSAWTELFDGIAEAEDLELAIHRSMVSNTIRMRMGRSS